MKIVIDIPEEVIEDIKKTYEGCDVLYVAVKYGTPLDDKTGHWDKSCRCSECGEWNILESEKWSGKYKFCPNCGAKMTDEVSEHYKKLGEYYNKGVSG